MIKILSVVFIGVFIGVRAYMDATLVAIHMGTKTRS